MTPDREQELLSLIEGLTDENYRLRLELRKIASERAQQISSWWKPPSMEMVLSNIADVVEVHLSPVYSRVRTLPGYPFSQTAEITNHLIAEELALGLTQEIEKQLKPTGDPE